uniref:Tyrosinase_Cu-bd domain-containing protein n=1 Tax=Steinernema glaseri TaxID=37863 RepID=A0A1I7ZB55_9BILA
MPTLPTSSSRSFLEDRRRSRADSYVRLDASVMTNLESKSHHNGRTSAPSGIRSPTTMLLPSSPFPGFSIVLAILLISASPVTARLPNPPVADCNLLPHSQFLTAQELDRACVHRSHWFNDLEAKSSTEFIQNITDSQRAYLASLERCIGDKCRSNCSSVQKKFRKDCYRHRREVPNPPRPKSIRKEYRMLTDEERQQLSRAMNSLKQKTIDNVTAWDLHTLIHYPDSAPGAHWGPAFLPWHREFLRQFELALQNEVPGVTLPYWDSTLDHGLPDPSDSTLWTDELLGNGNGYVKTGPFKDWDTNVFMPLSPVPVKKLYRYERRRNRSICLLRAAGSRPQDRLLTERDINWIESRTNYSELTFCHDKTFESMHGLSHVWVGGFMFVIRVSPNDPTFYMHHSFIDYVWERFRQKRQTRAQRETEYAKNTCNERHAPNAPMKPFKLKNIDGLSNDYTDYWYEYEPVRHCTKEKSFCDSKYLFCDKEAWKCRAKVTLGGKCKGFEGTDICYESECVEVGLY